MNTDRNIFFNFKNSCFTLFDTINPTNKYMQGLWSLSSEISKSFSMKKSINTQNSILLQILLI